MTAPSDREVVVYLRLPAHLKDSIIEMARGENLSQNAWAVNILRQAVLTGKGLPSPPPAHVPLPLPSEVLHAYITGESLVMPCGKVGSCEALVAPPERLSGVDWCGACGIRLS